MTCSIPESLKGRVVVSYPSHDPRNGREYDAYLIGYFPGTEYPYETFGETLDSGTYVWARCKKDGRIVAEEKRAAAEEKRERRERELRRGPPYQSLDMETD